MILSFQSLAPPSQLWGRRPVSAAQGKPRTVAGSAPQVRLSTFILLVSGLVHTGPRAPPRPDTVSSAISGPAGCRAKGSAPPASATPPFIAPFEPRSACGKRFPGIAVCPQRFLPWAAALSFCDSPILPVMGHVYCLAPPISLLVLRATSVWPRGAPIYIATLCQRSVFFRPEGRAAIPVS
ncbi:hypothetical protein NDU88_002239 [Pleurodeles waltl]|uniref:Uncharacterized protein n=1 Tax=Pleurodeles waltl TaxID=8319 RepID=A0AAV7MPY7_PLEWA|nr:hypothetical protein NDU88_002239 [Pleurodeles waltl]